MIIFLSGYRNNNTLDTYLIDLNAKRNDAQAGERTEVSCKYYEEMEERW